MKKTTLIVALLGAFAVSLMAAGHSLGSKEKATTFKVRHIPLTQELIHSGVPIIDIRTEKEWAETGVVPGSQLLTFFGEDGSYDVQAFMAQIQKRVGRDAAFALLCRSGNRSEKVGRFLAGKGFSSVINVYEGIQGATARGVPLQPYPSNP